MNFGLTAEAQNFVHMYMLYDEVNCNQWKIHFHVFDDKLFWILVDDMWSMGAGVIRGLISDIFGINL